MEEKYNEITVKNMDGDTITLKLRWDADIFEWITNFKLILKWLTFPEGTIKEVFTEEEE